MLAAIRQSTGNNRSQQACAELKRRIEHPQSIPSNLVMTSRAEIVDTFVEKAKAVSSTICRVNSETDVPGAVADYLRENNLPQDITMAPESWLESLNWEEDQLLNIRRGNPENEDMVGLTPAFTAIAETGTLVIASGAQCPSTLNFMPDYHLVALRASQICGDLEDAFDRLRQTYAKNGKHFVMPRTLNMITGPSRTGDIELTIHLGAHGPRSLHIILIDDEN